MVQDVTIQATLFAASGSALAAYHDTDLTSINSITFSLINCVCAQLLQSVITINETVAARLFLALGSIVMSTTLMGRIGYFSINTGVVLALANGAAEFARIVISPYIKQFFMSTTQQEANENKDLLQSVTSMNNCVTNDYPEAFRPYLLEAHKRVQQQNNVSVDHACDEVEINTMVTTPGGDGVVKGISEGHYEVELFLNSEIRRYNKKDVKISGQILSMLRTEEQGRKECSEFLRRKAFTEKYPLYPTAFAIDMRGWLEDTPVYVSGFLGRINQCWLSSFMHLLFTSSNDFDVILDREEPIFQFIKKMILQPFRNGYVVPQENMLALRLYMNDHTDLFGKNIDTGDWSTGKADISSLLDYFLKGYKNQFSLVCEENRSIEKVLNDVEVKDREPIALAKGDQSVDYPLAFTLTINGNKRAYEMSSVSCLEISHYISYNRVLDSNTGQYRWYRYDDQGDRRGNINIPLMQEITGLEEYLKRRAAGGSASHLEKFKVEIDQNARYYTYVPHS